MLFKVWFLTTKRDAHSTLIEKYFSSLTKKASLLLNPQITIEDLDSIDDEKIVHEEIDSDWEEKLLKIH